MREFAQPSLSRHQTMHSSLSAHCSMFQSLHRCEDASPGKPHGSIPQFHVRDFPLPHHFLDHAHGWKAQPLTQFFFVDDVFVI